MDPTLLRRYEELSTSELRVIAGPSRSDYTPDAVAVAEYVLASRPDTAGAAAVPASEQSASASDLERLLLDERQIRAISLLLWPVGLMIAMYQFSKGRRQRGRLALRWVGYAWVCKVIIVAVGALLIALR